MTVFINLLPFKSHTVLITESSNGCSDAVRPFLLLFRDTCCIDQVPLIGGGPCAVAHPDVPCLNAGLTLGISNPGPIFFNPWIRDRNFSNPGIPPGLRHDPNGPTAIRRYHVTVHTQIRAWSGTYMVYYYIDDANQNKQRSQKCNFTLQTAVLM
jgi:hypothetical protein